MSFKICAVLILSVIFETEACSAGKQMIKSGGITQEEMQAIVDEHNRLRQSVALGQVSSQPPAANMMEMKWDNELATRAQQWADNCVTAHDQATQRDVGRFPVGQNLAATWTTRQPSSPYDRAPEFKKQILAWFDEVRAYGYKPTGYSHGTGHYSQLVWGESSHVGCGFSFYYDPSRGYTKLYVCNYGPGGNVIGFKPYEKGQPSCSTYGLSDSQKYNGLCADSYGNTINEVSYEQPNAIPESAPDAVDTSSYDTYSYKSYSSSYESNSNYQWQTNQESDPKIYVQQRSNAVTSKPTTEAFTTPKPITFKPFISLFGNSGNNFGSSAEKLISNVLTPTRRGFRFGTLIF